MQMEINLPLMICFFIVTIMTISGEDYVSIELHGTVSGDNETIEFMGSAELIRKESTLHGKGNIFKKGDNPDKVDFTIIDNELRLTNQNTDGGTMDVSDFAEVHSLGDYIMMSLREMLRTDEISLSVKRQNDSNIYYLQSDNNNSLRLYHSNDLADKGAVTAGSWKLENEMLIDIVINKISFSADNNDDKLNKLLKW
jgi:hypothetical protein